MNNFVAFLLFRNINTIRAINHIHGHPVDRFSIMAWRFVRTVFSSARADLVKCLFGSNCKTTDLQPTGRADRDRLWCVSLQRSSRCQQEWTHQRRTGETEGYLAVRRVCLQDQVCSFWMRFSSCIGTMKHLLQSNLKAMPQSTSFVPDLLSCAGNNPNRRSKWKIAGVCAGSNPTFNGDVSGTQASVALIFTVHLRVCWLCRSESWKLWFLKSAMYLYIRVLNMVGRAPDVKEFQAIINKHESE